MHQDDDPVLLRVAEAVTDGAPVDWKAERAARPQQSGKVDHLRLIQEVARAHRAPIPPAEQAPIDRAPGEGALGLLTTSAAPPTAPATGISMQAGTPAAWGPLKILGPLGRGGYGDVYRAIDPALQREVALKLRRLERGASDAEARRFIQEARRLARVRHPNVLVVHGADRHSGRVGLWTDLLRGKTLEEALAEQGPFGAHEAALIGLDLCRALAAVHAAGLVHRDVKTTNVMREQGGRIVLMDFGSVAERPRDGTRAAGSDQATGTPLFMAPEHVLGDRPAAPASDIYSLGVVLYRLVTGRFPVEAQSWDDLSRKHRQGGLVSLRDARADLPTAFVQVVERALDPDPERRYASAGAMERALAASIGLAAPFGAGADAAATDTPARAASNLRCRIRRLAWIGGSALAVTAALVLWNQFRPAPGPLTVDASLFRLTQEAEERLDRGGRVGPGDRLFLEILGLEEMHVYVLNEDEKGDAYVLFPAGLDLRNPLPPGVRHRLPGRAGDRQMTWAVTSAGGREAFLVIASRHPLEDLERDIAGLPRAEAGRPITYPPVSVQTLEKLRGIGGLAPDEVPLAGTQSSRLAGIARSLAADAARDSGIWTWEIELENPSISPR